MMNLDFWTQLDRIERKLNRVLQNQGIEMAEIEKIGPSQQDMQKLTDRLKTSGDALQASVDADKAHRQNPLVRKELFMANPILDALQAQVTASTQVEASAKILIDGFAARMQAAVDAALVNGATAAELVPVQAEIDALKASSTDLSASVAANTPAAPPVSP